MKLVLNVTTPTYTYHEYIIRLKPRDVMALPAWIMIGQIRVTASGCMGTVDARWGVMSIGTAWVK